MENIFKVLLSGKVSEIIKRCIRIFFIAMVVLYVLQIVIALYFNFIPIHTRHYEEYGVSLKAYRGHIITNILPVLGPLFLIADDQGIVVIKCDNTNYRFTYDVYEDVNFDEVEIQNKGGYYVVAFPDNDFRIYPNEHNTMIKPDY